MDTLLEKNKKPLSLKEFKELVASGHKIVDSRDKHEYLTGFIESSLNIDLKAAFASWVGKLLKATDKFVVVASKG